MWSGYGHHVFSIFLQVKEIIIRELISNPKVYIWDGKGEDLLLLTTYQCQSSVKVWCFIFFFNFSEPNPHLGHLALADAFIITADSISMLSEACTTGYVQENDYLFPFYHSLDDTETSSSTQEASVCCGCWMVYMEILWVPEDPSWKRSC